MIDADRLVSAAPERLAPLFAPGVPAPLCGRLLGEPRFRDRLLALAADRLGTVSDVDAGGEALLALGPNDLRRFVMRVGAAWFGASVARMVDGESRRRLATRLDPDLLRYAIAARDAVPVPPEPLSDPDALADAIPRAGAAALAAWCAVQPQAVSRRLDLIRPAAEVAAVHLAMGPAVVGWVLEHP